MPNCALRLRGRLLPVAVVAFVIFAASPAAFVPGRHVLYGSNRQKSQHLQAGGSSSPFCGRAGVQDVHPTSTERLPEASLLSAGGLSRTFGQRGAVAAAVALSAAAASSESSASSPTASQLYFTGIAWYLMHFVIGIGNDGLMKFLGNGMAPFQIVFLRFVSAAVTLLPIMLIQGRKAFKTSRVWMHGFRGALLAAGIALWCFGLTLMDFASCVVVNNTMPFFKMTFAKIFLGENVGKERWIASFAGFLGCLIVFNPTADTFKPMSLVLLLSAVCFAMLDILNKKYAVEESTVSMLFYGSIATALLSAPVARSQWVPVSPQQWGLFGLLGMGANGLLFCLLRAFRYVDASATCPYRYTEFVLSAVAGFLFFAEKPTLATLLGSCIILPSVVYCAIKETEG
eukprot:CAMPEP_0178400942 /NCGR_PEP_ID=MMETSP0689_2-20121128/16047_1 /TAXON_ID=160604 /ORGANISM="Amphidinium massartii, Strain CS-259" /LENGTH=399 /DNA_ID=CAMNT_0020021749 /DNA_START=69 /DNA_END=1268 /DNA_ORIENTATION=+